MKLPVIIAMLFISGAYTRLFAQQDYKKMMEEAKEMISSEQEMDPALKEQMLKLMNSNEVAQGLQTAQESYRPAVELTTLPKRDEQRLAGISLQPLSKAEATQYIQGLTGKIETQLSTSELEQAKTILSKTDIDRDISNVGIASWYEGKPKLALYLVAKSAGKPQNVTGINNLAAMLNIAGYEEKAIPLLLFALQGDAKNSLLLNNLGRAYLGLGDKKSAEQYYLRCIAVAPTHPEANNALGCLYEEAGDPVKAERHFEKALEGGYNEEAMRHIQKRSPQQSIVLLIKKHHKAPAYFNQFQFQVPEECYSHKDYYRIQALHRSFQQGISALSNEYNALANENEDKVNQQIEDQPKILARALSTREMPSSLFSIYPFSPLASQMLLELQVQQAKVIRQFERDYKKDMDDLIDRKSKKAKEIEITYKAQYEIADIGECSGCCLNCEEVDRNMCKALEASDLNFQAAAASLHKNYMEKSRLQLTGYFDDLIYWYALLGPSQEIFDMNFYNTVVDFLSAIQDLSKSTPFLLGPETCDGQEAEKSEVGTNKYKGIDRPDCPVDITIPFVVGKLKLNCSSFSISGGEGATGSYSKNFVTGQSTLSIGAGITFEAGAKGVSASIGASETIYMTFDRNGNFSDTGLKFSSNADVAAGNISVGAGGGYTMGMNSGWNFTTNAPAATIQL